MHDGNELEDVMNIRSIPPMRSNLSERIIEAALIQERQYGRAGLSLWVHAFVDAFVMPHPAYALAFMLLLGGAAGYMDVLSLISTETVSVADMSDILYMGSDVQQEGDWL